MLLVETPRGAAASGARIAAIALASGRVPGVLHAAGPAAVSRDGRQVLITGTLGLERRRQTVAKAAETAFAPDRDVTVGGTAVANEQINSTVIKDLGFAELLAFPLLIALAILFFRGRAALMPLVVGVVTVLGTFLALSGINHLYGLSVFALNLVIGMGLGLAVDYSLFIVTRYREELAARRGRARGDRGDDVARRAHGAVLGGHGGLRARHADAVPAGLPEVDGDRRRGGRDRRGAVGGGGLAGAARPVGHASSPGAARAGRRRGAAGTGSRARSCAGPGRWQR